MAINGIIYFQHIGTGEGVAFVALGRVIPQLLVDSFRVAAGYIAIEHHGIVGRVRGAEPRYQLLITCESEHGIYIRAQLIHPCPVDRMGFGMELLFRQFACDAGFKCDAFTAGQEESIHFKQLAGRVNDRGLVSDSAYGLPKQQDSALGIQRDSFVSVLWHRRCSPPFYARRVPSAQSSGTSHASCSVLSAEPP